MKELVSETFPILGLCEYQGDGGEEESLNETFPKMGMF